MEPQGDACLGAEKIDRQAALNASHSRLYATSSASACLRQPNRQLQHHQTAVPTQNGAAHATLRLAYAIGGSALEDPRNKLVIVTEYNDEVQGFLVDSVDHIVSLDWEQTLPPPEDSEQGTYLSAVTQVDQEPVRIIDIERLLQALV